MFNDIDVSPLGRDHLVANTPVYLFKKFVRSPIVELIAKRFTPDVLVERIDATLERSPLGREEELGVYAAICAFAYFSLADRSKLRRVHNATRLEWAQQLIALVTAPTTAMSSTCVVVSQEDNQDAQESGTRGRTHAANTELAVDLR